VAANITVWKRSRVDLSQQLSVRDSTSARRLPVEILDAKHRSRRGEAHANAMDGGRFKLAQNSQRARTSYVVMKSQRDLSVSVPAATSERWHE